MPPAFAAHETALLFPTGGAHWPGMGDDLVEPEAHADLCDRAEAALVQAGAEPGALRRLMAGEQQAKRSEDESGWHWSGDFPLSVAAQTVVGSCLGHHFVRTRGEPGAVLGESMGECAAYCVAGALAIEQAVLLAYRWAGALQQASDVLGLRMVVVESLEREPLLALAAPLGASVVVHESATLFVLSVPVGSLGALRATLAERGVNMLVSTNPCVAHDPRLRQAEGIWPAHQAFLAGLDLRPAERRLWSALEPGRRLATVAELRANLERTTSTPVRWAEAVGLLPGLGIRSLLQLGVPARAYALEKLRSEDPRLAATHVRAVRSLRALSSARNSLPPPATASP
jgi:acyl transferase domain-containing protein